MFHPGAGETRDGQISYDLGWLIENGQVSQDSFCAFLLSEISPEIERLVSCFFKSPAERIAAVDHILLTVLRRRGRYKSALSGKAWLYGIIFETCLERTPAPPFQRGGRLARVLQAIDTRLADRAHFGPFLESMTEPQRLFAILAHGQNLSAEEVAMVLSIPPEPLQNELRGIRRLLTAHQQACQECSALPDSSSSLEAALREELQAPSRMMAAAQADNPDWAQSLLERVSREKKTLRVRKWAVHGLEAGLAALFVLLGVWAATHTWQIQSWISKPTQSTVFLEPSEKAASGPAPTATLLPPSIVTFSNPDAEKTFVLAQTSWARWKSLWADVEVKTYLPETLHDGAGNPSWKFERKQIWLSLPGSSRVISGARPDQPDLTYSIAAGRISRQDFITGEVFEASEQALIPDADLQKLFSPPDMFGSGGQFSWIGPDQAAGRPAWMLDWAQSGRRVFRYWIDQDYGVVLRRIEFGAGSLQPALADLVVTRIFFDADFPAALFEPFYYKGTFFTSDFSGGPEISSLKTALETSYELNSGLLPSGVVPSTQRDLASAHLSIKNVPAGWMESAAGPGLEIFADQYDLGKLPLGGKSVQACRRSPDGLHIAYNSPPLGGSKNTVLMLADLSSLQSIQPALGAGITNGDFAFSPDNTQLAFFGCEKASGFCGIFLLELSSGSLTRLAPLTYADSIVWSPDGRSLALVGNIDRSKDSQKFSSSNLLMNESIALSNTWFYEVIDTGSGDITFKRPYIWSTLRIPPDSPTLLWGKSRETPAAGFTACMDPPGPPYRSFSPAPDHYPFHP